MSKIQMFCLENRTKFSSDFRCSDFRHSGCLVCSIVWLKYKHPKSECSVGRVDQPNVWNPNKMVWISDTVWTVWEWDKFWKRRSPNVRISDTYCTVERQICMEQVFNSNSWTSFDFATATVITEYQTRSYKRLARLFYI